MVWDDLPLVTGAHTQTGVECHAFVEEVGKSDQVVQVLWRMEVLSS
jgi:hypothetical protein